jgi:hypothetical protein
MASENLHKHNETQKILGAVFDVVYVSRIKRQLLVSYQQLLCRGIHYLKHTEHVPELHTSGKKTVPLPPEPKIYRFYLVLLLNEGTETCYYLAI